MKRMRNQQGFTLIELMVVIVIIGILSAVAIPKFMGASAKAKMAEVPPVIAAYEHAQLAYVAETGSPGAMSDITFDAPTNSKWFTYAQGDSAGCIKATASTNVGDFASGSAVWSNIDASYQSFTHDATSGDPKTAAQKLIPNFF